MTLHWLRHARFYTIAFAAFSLFAHRAVAAEENLCTSPHASAVTLDVDKATEQDIPGAGNHYTNIVLSLKKASADALLTLTSQNVGAMFGYCIGDASAGSAGYIKSPFPVPDASGVDIAHIVIDKTRFDAKALLDRINAKTVPVKAVIAKRDVK